MMSICSEHVSGSWEIVLVKDCQQGRSRSSQATIPVARQPQGPLMNFPVDRQTGIG